MANSKNNGHGYRYATVDTKPAPGSGGYFTSEVAPRKEKIGRFYFSIRETSPDSSPSSGTVKLQFKCAGDTGWTEKKNGASAWAIGDRAVIADNAAGVVWRAGIADDADFTSGSITFGFDW